MSYKMGVEKISLRVIFKHKYLVILSDDPKFLSRTKVSKFSQFSASFGIFKLSIMIAEI